MESSLLNTTMVQNINNRNKRIKEAKEALMLYKLKFTESNRYEKYKKLENIVYCYSDVLDEILLDKEILLDELDVILIEKCKQEKKEKINKVKMLLNNYKLAIPTRKYEIQKSIIDIAERYNNVLDEVLLSDEYVQEPTEVYGMLSIFLIYLREPTILILLNILSDFEKTDYIMNIEKLIYSNIISGNNEKELIKVWEKFPNRQTNLNLNYAYFVHEKDAELFDESIPNFIKYRTYLATLPESTPYSYGDSKRNRIDRYSEIIMHMGCNDKRLEQMIAELTYMSIEPLMLFQIVYLSRNLISEKSMSRIIDYIINKKDDFAIYMFAKYIANAREELIKKEIDKEYIKTALRLTEDSEFVELHHQLTNINFNLIHSVSLNMLKQYDEVNKCYRCLLKMSNRYAILNRNSQLQKTKLQEQSGPVLIKKPTPPKSTDNNK